jgi:hypothetical protein
MLVRKIILIILLFSCSLYGFAQDEKKIAFAYGFELNRYTVRDIAAGGVLGFDINLPWRFAAGFNLTGSTGGYGNTVFEPSILFRYYFSDSHTEFFIQLDAGAVLINEPERTIPKNDDNEYSAVNFLIGVRLGYRYTFGSLWYVEPYIRAGYPFLAGAGVIFGYRY